jgi:hypothetical protein
LPLLKTMVGTYGFFGAGGSGFGVGSSLGEGFADRLQCRGERVTLCRELAAGVSLGAF